jgi:hypothetical protein
MQAAALFGIALCVGVLIGLAAAAITDYIRIRDKEKEYKARWAAWAEDTDLGHE